MVSGLTRVEVCRATYQDRGHVHPRLDPRTPHLHPRLRQALETFRPTPKWRPLQTQARTELCLREHLTSPVPVPAATPWATKWLLPTHHGQRNSILLLPHRPLWPTTNYASPRWHLFNNNSKTLTAGKSRPPSTTSTSLLAPSNSRYVKPPPRGHDVIC